MKSCVYAGSFDPVTKGHIDIVKRAAGLFDRVYVAVLNNSAKSYLFSAEERYAMMRLAATPYRNAEVVASGGLLVDLMKELGTRVIVRGLRSNADLELEQQLAAVNAGLMPGVETLVLLAGPEVRYISSTIVRELIMFGADISDYVPQEILEMIDGRNNV